MNSFANRKSRFLLRLRWLAFAASVGLAVVLHHAAARADDAEQFVSSGGEALGQRLQIPWYDASTDSLRPVEIRARRTSLDWLANPILALVIFTVAAILVLLAVLAARAWRLRDRQRTKDGTQSDPRRIADQVEALPFLRERPLGDLLAQARTHYEQGNYSEAIIYLFSYELVELDRSALIRLAKGKTNRQYVREAAATRSMKPLLERTMVTFEDVFFGRRTLDRSGFEACWKQLDEFQSLLAGVPAIA